MELPKGASVSAEELKKVSDGLAALEKDPHAPRETSINVTLHVHNEYPKTMYKGKEVCTALDADAEELAIAQGYGPYDHEAFTAA